MQYLLYCNGLPWWLSGKEPACQCWRCGFNFWVGKISWRRQWQPTPVFLPGKSHGWGSLVGYSPWGRKESDMTERLHFHFQRSGGSDSKESACNSGDPGSISGSGRSLGEGNGNRLQYSCLENPMDGGAGWVTVHGVAKSQTQLSDLHLTSKKSR